MILVMVMMLIFVMMEGDTFCRREVLGKSKVFSGVGGDDGVDGGDGGVDGGDGVDEGR